MLDQRLQRAFDYLVLEKDCWDFCCDHGLLGKAIIKSGAFGEVHFVDKVSNIMKKLDDDLAEYFKNENYKTHSSDLRFEKLNPEGNLLFLGIGSKSMIEMLKVQCPQAREGLRLILCPNKGSEILREYLSVSNWKLVYDELIADKKDCRDFLVCEIAGEDIKLFGNKINNCSGYENYINDIKKHYLRKKTLSKFEKKCVDNLSNL